MPARKILSVTRVDRLVPIRTRRCVAATVSQGKPAVLCNPESGDWYRGSRRFQPASLLAEPGHQHVEAGESFVARLTTRIGARARECGAVRSDTKAEAFRKRVLRDRRLL